jgi:hypothetical protein
MKDESGAEGPPRRAAGDGPITSLKVELGVGVGKSTSREVDLSGGGKVVDRHREVRPLDPRPEVGLEVGVGMSTLQVELRTANPGGHPCGRP